MGIKEPQVTRAHLISFRRSGPGRHVRTLNGMRENTSGSAGQRSARTLRKANRMSAAVEKRSTLTGAHALIRNPSKNASNKSLRPDIWAVKKFPNACASLHMTGHNVALERFQIVAGALDRKSTRLNSSH